VAEQGRRSPLPAARHDARFYEKNAKGGAPTRAPHGRRRVVPAARRDSRDVRTGLRLLARDDRTRRSSAYALELPDRDKVQQRMGVFARFSREHTKQLPVPLVDECERRAEFASTKRDPVCRRRLHRASGAIFERDGERRARLPPAECVATTKLALGRTRGRFGLQGETPEETAPFKMAVDDRSKRAAGSQRSARRCGLVPRSFFTLRPGSPHARAAARARQRPIGARS
jgi:hypothetical protein